MAPSAGQGTAGAPMLASARATAFAAASPARSEAARSARVRTRTDACGIAVLWSGRADTDTFCDALIAHVREHDPAFGFVWFSPTRHAAARLVERLEAEVPDFRYGGCSTSGEITPDGQQQHGVLAVLLPRAHFRVSISTLERVHTLGMEAIARHALDARRRFLDEAPSTPHRAVSEDAVFAMCLIDGLVYAEEAVTTALDRGLDGLPLIGGSAGDDLAFERTELISAGRAMSGAALLVLIECRLPFRLFTDNNFVPTEHRLVVTESDPERRIVHEFNAEPAAEAYARAIGVDPAALDPRSFASHALVVRIGGEYYARSIQRVDADGSLSFLLRHRQRPGADGRAFRRHGARLARGDRAHRGGDRPARLAVRLRLHLPPPRRPPSRRDRTHRDPVSRQGVRRVQRLRGAVRSMHINQTLTGVAIAAPAATARPAHGGGRRRVSEERADGEAPDEHAAGREIERLRKINAALIERVERSTDNQGTAFSLFQTAIGLEDQVRRRTQELTTTLADLERSNLELKRARDVAVEANRSKTHFLAAASHDVLQPLNAALLLMSSLESVQTHGEGQRLCRQVERSLGTMDALLRTLLYMSRLDAGDVRPQWQSVSLDALFASLASDFEPTARQRGLELRVRASGLHVHSDPTMLRRLLQNIVTNALRYTERGGVLLIAGRRGDEVHVRVADTGVGIPRERFRDIFVEFSRCESPAVGGEDASAGLGLGLAIVERMARTLEHDITLNSRIGHGSCFGLTMRYAPPPAPAREKGPPLGVGDASAISSLVGARILVIENDLVALQALEALLCQWGCRLRLASSTAEAADAIVDGAWLPDIVVADQHLDGKDRGTSTVRLVRRTIGQDIPAVIVTAAPSPALTRSTRRDRLELMAKPLKPAQLRALLMHLRSRSTLPVSA